MNESENYLDQLLNAVDGRSDLNDSDPVNPEEIESKEQMPQKSTRETIDIPDSNDLFMDQFEQELRKDNDPDEFLKQFEQELDRDESSQGVTKATQPMLDDIDQIMESVNQEAANDTAEMAASAVEKTAEQKEDTAEVKNDEDASEDGIDDLAIDDIGIDDFGLDNSETENEKAVSDEDDELMRILSGTGEDSEIPEADNAKAEVQPDDEVKEEKKPKKQGFLAKLSKLLFGDDEPDEEEISGMQAEPAVTEMSMDDMDILKELEGSSDGDKKGGKEKKKKEKKKKEKAPKQPKEKKVKPKKEKKPKPPAEPDNTPPLPKGPVIAIVLMAVSLFAFVMIVTNLLGYQANLSQAKEKYEQGSYVEAYSKLQGLSIKERDEKLYHQLATLAAVSEKYQAYLVFDNYGSKIDALDALVCAYGRYDLNQKNAKEYGCEDQLEKIGGKIIKALLKDYDMTGDEALDIYQTRKRDDYTVKLHQKLKELGLG